MKLSYLLFFGVALFPFQSQAMNPTNENTVGESVPIKNPRLPIVDDKILGEKKGSAVPNVQVSKKEEMRENNPVILPTDIVQEIFKIAVGDTPKKLQDYRNVNYFYSTFIRISRDWKAVAQKFLENSSPNLIKNHRFSWRVSTENAANFNLSLKELYAVSEKYKWHAWEWDAEWSDFKEYYLNLSSKEDQHYLEPFNLVTLAVRPKNTKNSFYKETILLELLLSKCLRLQKIIFYGLNVDDTKFFDRLAAIVKESQIRSLVFRKITSENNQMWAENFNKVANIFFSSHLDSNIQKELWLDFKIEFTLALEFYTLLSSVNKKTFRLRFSANTNFKLGKHFQSLDRLEEAEFYYLSSDISNSWYSLLPLYILQDKTTKTLDILEHILENGESNIGMGSEESIQLAKNSLSTVRSSFILTCAKEEKKKSQALILKPKDTHLKRELTKLRKVLAWMLFNITKLVKEPHEREKLVQDLKADESALYSIADNLCKNILKEDEEDVDVLILRSKHISFREGPENAIDFLKSAPSKIQDKAKLQFYIGYYYYRLYKENTNSLFSNYAVEYLKKSSEQGHISAKMVLAHLYSLDENYSADEVLALHKEAAKKGNSYSQFWLWYAYSKGNIGNLNLTPNQDKANKWLDQAKESNNSWAIYKFGKDAMKLKNFALAKELFSRKTESSYCQDSLGFICANIEKNYSEAENFYERATKLDPTSYSAWRNWGRLKYLQYKKEKDDSLNSNWRIKPNKNLLIKAKEYTSNALRLIETPSRLKEAKKRGIQDNLTKIETELQ